MRRVSIVRAPLVVAGLVAAVAGAVSAAGCRGEPAAPGDGGVVAVEIVPDAATKGAGAYAPNPAVVRLADGGRVRWRNADAGAGGGPYDDPGGATHTVTADAGGFDSGSLGPGLSFTHSFTAAGTYGYHCALHPEMTGTIRVDP